MWCHKNPGWVAHYRKELVTFVVPQKSEKNLRKFRRKKSPSIEGLEKITKDYLVRALIGSDALAELIETAFS